MMLMPERTNHKSPIVLANPRSSERLSPLTFHLLSPPPLTLRRANACSGQASHFPVRHSPASAGRRRITSHGRDSGLAVRLQDLFLILSQGVDLGLLAVAAAFRTARDLKKILGKANET